MLLSSSVGADLSRVSRSNPILTSCSLKNRRNRKKLEKDHDRLGDDHDSADDSDRQRRSKDEIAQTPNPQKNECEHHAPVIAVHLAAHTRLQVIKVHFLLCFFRLPLVLVGLDFLAAIL